MEIQKLKFFESKDLLSQDDMVKISSTTTGPNEKAIIIANKLKKYCFVDKLRNLFILNTEIVTYRRVSDTSQDIKILASKLIEQTYNSFDDFQKRVIIGIDKTLSCMRNNSIYVYESHLITYLIIDVNVDVYYDQIHFRNGYWDLCKGKLKARKVGTHYITKYVDDDYIESKITTAIRKEVKNDLNKTYPDKKDRDCILYKFGKALTGRSTDDQGIFAMLGKGSSGKSTIYQIIKACLPCYIKTLKEDTLAYSASTVDKVINTFISEPQIRLAIVNDAKDTKLNDSVIKNFADGEIDTTKLYCEGSHTVKLYCMLVLIMNTLIQTKIDSGIIRRMKHGMFQHTSEFVDDKKQVNTEKHIYLKDKQFLNRVKTDTSYRLAFTQILFDNAKKTYEKSFVPSENFNETFNSILNANNFIGDFIDKYLTITGKEDDRIGKDSMHKEFKLIFPDKMLTSIQLISSLKDQNITYSSKFRCDGLQGCYTGVKFKDQDVESENDYENGIEKKEQSVDINKAYKELEAKYNALLASSKTVVKDKPESFDKYFGTPKKIIKVSKESDYSTVDDISKEEIEKLNIDFD